jgi:hypothetical protein
MILFLLVSFKLSQNKVADSVKPDSKNRIVLSKVQVKEGITYHIYVNSIGQIVLAPQVTISLGVKKIWLYANPEALVSVQRVLEEAAQEKSNKPWFIRQICERCAVSYALSPPLTSH